MLKPFLRLAINFYNEFSHVKKLITSESEENLFEEEVQIEILKRKSL